MSRMNRMPASGRHFFWPKDFTFVCPTEIAAFGKLNREFADATP